MSQYKINEIIRKLLFNQNMRITDLARATNVPQQTVQRISSGKCLRPHPSSLQPIADFFSITLEQLKGEKPIPWLQNQDQCQYLEEMGVKQVPLIEWANVTEWILGKYKPSPGSVKALTECSISSRAFALMIKDASMEPLFPIGTQIILDPNVPYNDRYYVLVKLQQHQDPIFRQLILDAEDHFIKPLSPDLDHFSMHLLGTDDKIQAVLVEAKHKYLNS